MRFVKRQVKEVTIKLVPSEVELVHAVQDTNRIVQLYAHVDDEVGNQMFGIEVVNTKTGEYTSRQINLAKTDSYTVTIVEILAVEK